jgi:hypothetical protein
MVLVSETKFSDRELDKAILIRLQAMPLHQYIEQGHGEGESRLKILPAAMADSLPMKCC